jgi:hypothetical protein
MSVPSDVVPVPLTPAFPGPFADLVFEPDQDEEATRFREINARRAQVENPEMLRRLRGL